MTFWNISSPDNHQRDSPKTFLLIKFRSSMYSVLSTEYGISNNWNKAYIIEWEIIVWMGIIKLKNILSYSAKCFDLDLTHNKLDYINIDEQR